MNRLLASVFITVALAITVAASQQGRGNSLAAIKPIPGVSFRKLEPARPRSSRIKRRRSLTQQFHRLRGIRHAMSGSRSAAAVLGAHQRLGGYDDVAYQNVTTANAYGTQYALWATVGDTSVELTIDTGSADTWVVKHGFSCLDYTGSEVAQASCGFGPVYPSGYQHGRAPDVHMFVRYGDGELVMGDMGYSDVTVANITVKRQQISLANQTFWYGDNTTSGILGLAFPSMVNAYLGEWGEHDAYELEEYPPLFTNMWQQGLVEPSFALAIERNSTGGVIGWGGVPTILTGLDYSTVTFADIIIASLNGNPWAASEPSFYTIIPDGIQYNMVKDADKYPYIIDSGTSINYLPQQLADSINAAFDPPAVYVYQLGAYFTSCDAVAPLFAVLIGGVALTVNPRDMIYRDFRDPITGLCMTAVGTGGSGPFILGDAFLQNVVVEFDIANAEIHFMSRPYY